MAKQVNVAVAGATGAVGKEILSILAQRQFPVGRVFALASARSKGKTAAFNGEELPVTDLAEFDFKQAQIALFSAGGGVSAAHAPRAAAAGCVVVDNSSHFRYDDEIPLVATEVNPQKIAEHKKRGIVANPNCSTIQLVTALQPLHVAAQVRRINVATYQAVSGAGASAIEALAKQSANLLAGKDDDASVAGVFSARIAFNVIPHIDQFMPNGYTREEMKMVWETQKIMDDPAIAVNATAARVPVFYGHSEAAHIEFANSMDSDAARQLLAEAPGVCVIDGREAGEYPMPATHAAGNDEVFVGRIRDDLTQKNAINMWIVSDNLRKGAALNAVQIAEHLIDQI